MRAGYDEAATAATAVPAPVDGRQESITQQVARAQRLLAASLTLLRDSFVSIADDEYATLPADSIRRQHFERAVIALQSEDSVGQLLELIRQRTEKLERAVSRARSLVGECGEEPPQNGSHAPCPLCSGTRFAELRAALRVPDTASQSVTQSQVAPGHTQLF